MAKPTKAELKEERKSQWEEKADKDKKSARMRKFTIWGIVIAVFVVFVGLLIWLLQSPSSTTSSNITIAPVTSNDISQGPANAKVTVVEYADFQCPAFKAYHPLVNQLLSDEKGKIRYVYRFFPLTTIHQNAMIGAQAGYAAFLQGKFWDMDNLLFDNQDSWATLSDSDARAVFASFAQKLGMNVTQFKKDIDSDATKKFVTDEQNEGLTDGINSTPSFFINGKEITNPNTYADFKKLVDDTLSAK